MAAGPPFRAIRLLLPVALLLGAAAPDGESDARLQTAAEVREADRAVNDAAQRVVALEAQHRAAQARLDERAAALAPLLPLAERLAMYPAETLLAVPVPPAEAVRGLAVLHGLMRTVEREAAAVRGELANVEAAQRELDSALPQLRAAQAAQRLKAATLDRQMEAARALRARTEDAAAEEARRAAAEATRAESVGAALETMEAARTRAEQQLKRDAERAAAQRRSVALSLAQKRAAEVAAPRGPGVALSGAVLPVVGPVVRRWGEATDAGPARGMAFRSPPNGRVVSPCAGRVAFAGPFRSYGVLVILDCGGKYHFVLAGLDRLDVDAGVAVRPGDPLGSMPDWDPALNGRRPALYVELRHDGDPVDPAPYLRPGS